MATDTPNVYSICSKKLQANHLSELLHGQEKPLQQVLAPICGSIKRVDTLAPGTPRGIHPVRTCYRKGQGLPPLLPPTLIPSPLSDPSTQTTCVSATTANTATADTQRPAPPVCPTTSASAPSRSPNRRDSSSLLSAGEAAYFNRSRRWLGRTAMSVSSTG